MPAKPIQSTDADPIYEMLWDCEYCGSKKLLGKTQRFCPECGAGQDPDRRYYPDDAEKIAVHDHKYVGADKTCPACSHPNSANSEFCTQCGSPMDAAKIVATRDSESHADDQAFSQSKNKKHSAKNPKAVPPVSQPISRKKIAIIGFIAVLAVLIATFIFWTKEVSVQATGFSWQRVIYIDSFSAKTEGTWCDQTPSSAYNIKHERKIRDYKQIPDGQSCQTRRIDQGDGTYKERKDCQTKYRKEPIYDQYCHYKIDKWASYRSATAQAKDKSPHWPQSNLRCEGQRRIGCERESRRDTHYLVQLYQAENKKNYQCDLSEKLWLQSQVGSQWQLKISAMTGGERCGSLIPLK